MTNAENLRKAAQNEEALAECLHDLFKCDGCPIRHYCIENISDLCKDVIEKWLKEECKQ